MSTRGPGQSDLSDAAYRCPGAGAPISRAVHLARLAAGDPACRRCVRRGETEGLSPGLVQRIRAAHDRPEPPSLWGPEGLAGAWPHRLGPAEFRRAAEAMGIYLRQNAPGGRAPRVLIAGNGAPHAPEALAAAGEGLRWAGCDLVELEPLSAGAMDRAIEHLEADGGLMVGTPGFEPHVAGARFWHGAAAGSGEMLAALARLFDGPRDRPSRTFGAHRRESITEAYLAHLAHHYHALRPLVVLLETPCQPLVDYLRRLTASSACEIREGDPRGDAAASASARPTREGSPPVAFHFAARVDGDGRRCEIFDERGELVGEGWPDGIPVVQRSPRVGLGATGCLSASAGNTGRQAARGTQQIEYVGLLARHATGPAEESPLQPDALLTITDLLVLLSQRDRPLSEVVAMK